MLTIDPRLSTLLVVDFQTRLMPAIDQGEDAVANTRKLLDAAAMLGVPAVFTEQNPKGLGSTVPALAENAVNVVHKMTFDAGRAPELLRNAAKDHAFVVTGCEAHVCVLQTVLGLLEAKRKVFVVRDAIGSRRAESKDTAIARMDRHGAEIVTTEMVVFEWLETAEHPQFKQVAALIK